MLRLESLGQPGDRVRRQFRCDARIHETGQICNKTYSRQWNLTRHQAKHHPDPHQGLVFIPYIPNARQSNVDQPSLEPAALLPAIGPTPEVLRTTNAHVLEHSAPVTPLHPDVTPNVTSLNSQNEIAPVFQRPTPSTPTPDPTFAAVEHCPSQPPRAAFASNSSSAIPTSTAPYVSSAMARAQLRGVPSVTILAPAAFTKRTTQMGPGPTSALNPRLPGEGSNEWDHERLQYLATVETPCPEPFPDTGGSRKRRNSSVQHGRSIKASLRELIPIYEVKGSKKLPNQQRGLDWLSSLAKRKFDDYYSSLLAQWGVNCTHRGTCVLCPEDWRDSNPLDLLPRFNNHSYPTSRSKRAWYSYSDHETTLARAAVWFANWPRTGQQLDNFLGSGPYKPMDASHLCHQEYCLIHVVYEGADTNWDRTGCRDRARFLRGEGRYVPEHCDKHNPPCLMQHAALTTLEAYYIQFWVLRRAKGIEAIPQIPRPRYYVFSTFETQLPCGFSAVHLDPVNLVTEATPLKKEGKPNLFCEYCEKIKPYSSLIGYWGHVFHRHQDVDDKERLQEIKRTASLWQTYWERHSDGGKGDNPTQAKLEQIQGDGFSWQDVRDWALRR